jgi:sulfite reductase (NADPH) flavoprotein alpha-component
MNLSPDLVPHIPEDSPFSPAQRAWLNGFLAGLYSYAPASIELAKPLRVALLYGSQTGTAEGLARKLAKEWKTAGFEVVLNSLEGYVPATLAAETHAVFIVSTYGEGEPPDSVQPFFQQLCIEHFPLLRDLSYSLLALGDSHYEHFCQFGRDLDAKLQSLGATCCLNRVECDVELDAPYAEWKQAITKKLRELANPAAPKSEASATTISGNIVDAPAPSQPAHTRENPYHASVAEKRALTHPSSSKSTIHVGFDITASQLTYEAGDACGLVPENCPELVDTVLSNLPFTGKEIVNVSKVGEMSLSRALRSHFTLTRLSRKIVARYAEIAQCSRLRSLLQSEQQTDLENYLDGRDIVDLLQECPNVLPTPETLIEMLPRLVPRLYSISSSPAAHPGRIHTTVSVVRYRTHERDRKGVCSTLLADRIDAGDSLPIYIQPNKKFRLPEDQQAPIIMVGPGTGIAPFRAFLYERQALNAKGRNWLFFGERSTATDFLYRDEIEKMVRDKHLTHLDVAFSRDQKEKIYVQDLMLKNAKQLWAWLQDGAYFYVCGDAARMAKDVDRTLQTIVREQGGLSPDTTETYIQQLKDQRRYQRDIY